MPAHNLESLLTELLTVNHFLTAAQMVEVLAQQGRPFNKTSVYRALDRMLAGRVLCEHYFTAKQGLVYELRSHHHDHVACEHCGKVWASDCEDAQGESRCLQGGGTSPLPVGFQVSHHHVTWFGVCADCQQHQTSNSPLAPQ